MEKLHFIQDKAVSIFLATISSKIFASPSGERAPSQLITYIKATLHQNSKSKGLFVLVYMRSNSDNTKYKRDLATQL